jgi:starvation-inducible DNA-binding protein
MTNRSVAAAPIPAAGQVGGERGKSLLVAALNQRLADSIDLHSQVKVAHWNVKGPHFAALHPQFEQFAIALAARIDQLAERAVTLGGQAEGTARVAVQRSGLAEYDVALRDGLAHVRLLRERFAAFLAGLRETRNTAEAADDADTVDLLTQIVGEFEKYEWFLRATGE